jgi:SAM-dependent methyltransferase
MWEGSETFEQVAHVAAGEGSPTDRRRFEETLRKCAATVGIDAKQSVLIVGGSFRDAHSLYRAGFRRMTLSNVEPLVDVDPQTEPMPDADITLLYADLEKLPVADASYDLVLAHEVLHHCRSPHAALVEMLRVSRRNIVLMEPNDSLAMRWLIRLRFSTPYELPAVIYNEYKKGGVNNSDIPNFIYRWDPRTIYQTVATCLPEREFGLYLRRYWDFNITAEELEQRRETRIGVITRVVGPRHFIALLHGFQAVANSLPWIARQGNKFFACITKQHALKPWIVERDGAFGFNRAYGKS